MSRLIKGRGAVIYEATARRGTVKIWIVWKRRGRAQGRAQTIVNQLRRHGEKENVIWMEFGCWRGSEGKVGGLNAYRNHKTLQTRKETAERNMKFGYPGRNMMGGTKTADSRARPISDVAWGKGVRRKATKKRNVTFETLYIIRKNTRCATRKILYRAAIREQVRDSENKERKILNHTEGGGSKNNLIIHR